MKKTFNINLGGIVFHIDEDAYELLDNYLNNLRIHFGKEEGAEEIVRDMELRISELFTERLHEGKQVITLRDVEEIIAQMGKPEDLSEEESPKDSHSASGQERGTKRLYCDPDNKVIGGVCSGIAAYMGWDVTIVRLVFLILGCFVHGFIIAYIVAWFVIPEASTATEKLSMKGIKANVENIGKTVTEGFERVCNDVNSERTKSMLQRIGEAIVNVAGFIIKCLLIILALCLAPVLFVLLIVFFSLLMVALGLLTTTPATVLYELMPHVDWTFLSASPTLAVLLAVCGILLVGLPIIGIVHTLMSTFGSWRPMSVGVRIAFIGIWICALCAGLYFLFLLNAPIVWHNLCCGM